MKLPKALFSMEYFTPQESVIAFPAQRKIFLIFFVGKVCLSVLGQYLKCPQVISPESSGKARFCCSVVSCECEHLVYEPKIVLSEKIKAALYIAMTIFFVVEVRTFSDFIRPN
jgi:hypothetical protein